MRSIIISFVLVLSFLCCYAQDKQEQFTTLPNIADTASISVLISSAKTLRHSATDSGIHIYETALVASRKLNFIDGIARSLMGLGLFHMDKGDYAKAIEFDMAAIPYCEASHYAGGVLIAGLYNNMAAVYGNRGVYDSAAYFYYKALDKIEQKKIADTTLLLLIYSNLGGRLAEDKQPDQAVFYLSKGEALALKTHNERMLAKMYVDLATLYGTKKDYKKAVFYAEDALRLFSKFKDPASQIVAYCILGNIYLDQQQPQKALTYFQHSFDKGVNGSQPNLAVAYRGIGGAYYQMKEYSKAEENYLRALAIAKTARLNKGMMECYKALVAINTDLGNYKQALEYRNNYADLSDSIFNAEKVKTFNNLEFRYRTAEKDKQLVSNKLQLTEQRDQLKRKNILIATIAAGTLLLIALFGSMYRARKHRQNLVLMQLEKEKEIEQLKATMMGEEKERVRIARELHDGIMAQFSSVQMNLSALVEHTGLQKTGAFDDILNQLDEATKDLRKSAHNLMPDMLLEEGLAEATHYFCKNLQQNTRIDIDCQMYGAMPAMAKEYELMIYRVIQELLQNTIKHARATAVIVQMNCQEDMISIAVEDNGVGFDQEHTSFKGMGLKGIKARIDSLHGHFTIKSDKERGTSVYIELETKYLKEAK